MSLGIAATDVIAAAQRMRKPLNAELVTRLGGFIKTKAGSAR